MRNNIPTDIVESVRETISQPTNAWFPELSSLITSAAWSEFSYRGFTPTNYGTHRWLKNDPTADRLCIAELDLDKSLHCRIETLPVSSRAYYEEAGLIFPAFFSTNADVKFLRSAISLMNVNPSLHATIAQFLRSLHILESPGDDYDVSHSDPEVPFSIFISIPPPNRLGRLRLAESIIHECMHLQLTLIERILPLIGMPESRLFSPWQNKIRPLSGVLHGLYVFTVIYDFFGILERRGFLTSYENTFIGKRRNEIVEEAVQVATIVSAKELTNEGRNLACYLNRCLGL